MAKIDITTVQKSNLNFRKKSLVQEFSQQESEQIAGGGLIYGLNSRTSYEGDLTCGPGGVKEEDYGGYVYHEYPR